MASHACALRLLDDDVLLAIKERARRENRTAGEDLALKALTSTQNVGGEVHSRHGFDPLPHRGKAVSNALIDQLREEELE